jgi:hypothetical protein
MIRPLFALLLLASPLPAPAAESPKLTPLKHRVIFDQTTYLRANSDRRCSIWTDKSSEATPLLGSLGVRTAEAVTFKKGEILVAFLNDKITESLTAMIHNETAREFFGDYADSGIAFKLAAPPSGMKYSHLTVVIFDSPEKPSHIGIRGMIPDGLSENFSDAKK